MQEDLDGGAENQAVAVPRGAGLDDAKKPGGGTVSGSGGGGAFGLNSCSSRCASSVSLADTAKTSGISPATSAAGGLKVLAGPAVRLKRDLAAQVP